MWYMYVSGLKLMVVSIVILNETEHKTLFLGLWFSLGDKHGSLIFSLCYFNSSNCHSLFSTLHFSTPLQCLLPPTIAMLSPGPCTTTLLVPVSNQENPPETIWRAINMVSMYRSTIFFRFPCTCNIQIYFTGYREWVVYYCSYQLSDWFPNKKSYSKNKSCVMVFFSYQTNTGTKHELPAGDQCWKCSRQCSAFGRIGDQ